MKTYKHEQTWWIASNEWVEWYIKYWVWLDDCMYLPAQLIENSKDRVLQEEEKDSLLEELSDLEHKQRINRAKSISEEESISLKRRKRWLKYFCDYSELPEDVKEYDREYARKVIDVVEKHMPKITEEEIKVKCNTLNWWYYMTDIMIIELLKEKWLYKE